MPGTDKNCLQNFDTETLKDEASWGPRVCVDGRKGLAYLKKKECGKKSVAICSGLNWLEICSNGSNDHSGSKYMHNFLISSATISLSTKILLHALITARKDNVASPRDAGFRYLSFGRFKDVDVLRSLRRLTTSFT